MKLTIELVETIAPAAPLERVYGSLDRVPSWPLTPASSHRVLPRLGQFSYIQGTIVSTDPTRPGQFADATVRDVQYLEDNVGIGTRSGPVLTLTPPPTSIQFWSERV